MSRCITISGFGVARITYPGTDVALGNLFSARISFGVAAPKAATRLICNPGKGDTSRYLTLGRVGIARFNSSAIIANLATTARCITCIHAIYSNNGADS